MTDNTYESSIISNFYMDENGVPHAKIIVETQQVSTTKNIVQLTNIPYVMDNLKITASDGKTPTDLYRVYNMDEISEDTNAYYLTSEGLLYFNSAQSGKTFTFDYYGAGVVLLSTNRVFYRDSENVVHLLEDLISQGYEGLQFASDLGSSKEVINKLETDITNGNTTITNIDNKIKDGNTTIANINTAIANGDLNNKADKSYVDTQISSIKIDGGTF